MKIILVMFFALLLACGTVTQQQEFITVNGTQFIKEGKPYYFLGTNVWYGANLAMEGESGDRERLIKELDLLHSLGVTNLRILGASEQTQYFNTVKPAMQTALGEYDENVLGGLDFLLAEMGKRDMTAVVYLNNYWVWSGGMAQYVAWCENETMPNPFLDEYDWHTFMLYSGRFYTHEQANQAYRDYIEMLINRKNTVNGKLYKDDPVIMAWQLSNEPRPNPGEERDQHINRFIEWVDETAGYIKSLDPNHLVSTGNEGLKGSLESEPCYLDAHRSEHIDYLTFHLWILNWSWYDPQRPGETYPDAQKKALDYIDQHIKYAETMGKPVTFEEFGIPRDQHSYSPEASTIWRDRYLKTVFDKIYAGIDSGSPLAGSNFWAWGGYGKARDPENDPYWQEGDDFTGDPPQEPQGRNSVFAGDSTTLQILKSHSQKLESILR